jgi:branched-chain amino acid transport system permease protein
MDLLLEQITSGLSNGAIYASLALALVMIFNSTNHINFAQGEMALLSTYFAWTLIAAGLPYWAAFLLTVVASFVFGVALERVVMRAFRTAEHLSLVVVFVGLLLIFNSLAGWVWGFMLKEFPSPVRSLSTGTPYFNAHDLLVLGVTVAELTIMFVFFRYTKLGLAMRASALNPTSARLTGIRVGWMLALGWGMAGALGAVAGMLIAPIVYLDPNMMLGVLLYAFASAMLGGLGNPAGAVAGALIFGVLENLVGTYVIGSELKLSFALVVVIAVLLVKPAGLFGSAVVRRV